MTLYEYNILSLDERASFLWEHGTFLLNDEVEGKRVNLYALGDFYVEAWYNNETNTIEQLRSFKSLNQLDRYLHRLPSLE